MNYNYRPSYEFGPEEMPLETEELGPIFIYYLITFGLICSIVAWLLWSFPNGGFSDNFILAGSWVNIIWGGIGFCRALRRSGMSVLAMTYVFQLIFFGLVPFASFRSGLWTWGNISNSDTVAIRYALVSTHVFMIFTLLGYKFCPKQIRDSGLKWWAKREVTGDRIYLALGAQVVGMLLLMFALGTDGLMFRAGGNLGLDPSYGKAPTLVVGLIIRPMMLYLGLYALYLACHSTENLMVKTTAWVVAAFGLAANLPQSTARFYSLFTITGIIFCLLPKLRRNSLFVLSYIITSFAASPIADQFRGVRTMKEFFEVFIGFKFSSDYVFIGNFDAFEILVYSINYAQDRGITWGRQMLGVVLFWVPRSYWSSKPLSTGELLGSDFIGKSASLANTNISTPLPAEGFINFGLTGVITIGVVYGMFAIWMDRLNAVPGRKGDMSGAGFGVAVFLPSIAALSLILQRGTLIVGFSDVCGVFLACWMASLFFLRRTD